MKNYLLRFTIPFHISNFNEISHNDFTIVKNLGWVKQHIIKDERDLYNYINNLIDAGEKNTNVNTYIAASFRINDKKKKEIINIQFNSNLRKGNIVYGNVDWNIEDLGLIIYNNGICLLWYEINAQDLKDTDSMILFMYQVKELARYKGRIKSKDNDEEISLYGDVLRQYISCMNIDNFFPNRTVNDQLYPDRGIPFSWIYDVDDGRNDLNLYDTVFHMGRNYNPDYSMPTDFEKNNFYKPFDDSIWYGSLEGCGNYTCCKENKYFFDKIYKPKKLDTYFYLFLLCTGQYYSLLMLSQMVSELPLDENMYSTSNSELEQMVDRIHIFYLKNNFSQVGHLTQHNEFYQYLQQRMGISDLQNELETELQSLYDIVGRKRQIKTGHFYKAISITSAIFVILQTLDNIVDLFDIMEFPKNKSLCLGISGMLLCTAIGVIIYICLISVERVRNKKKI